jgi:peptidoglycan hydrolase-like protein with peptidoglycan-binding domain
MKRILLFLLSFVVLLSSVLMVASATGDDLADDMFDDDENVTYDNGTTATTKGGLLGGLGNIGGDGVGDFVGGVVESVFQDNDVSQQVGGKVEGILGVFEGFDLDGLIPTTTPQTVGSNFFDTIDPVVTGSYNSNLQQNTTASTPISSLNGENVDYNTTVNPYQKPTTQLNPGDKGDGVKWLQWILIYTECGLQGSITGEYDDATAAAVKNLQLKYGMTVDGIATTEVIEKAELMYNEYINGISNSTPNAPVVFNTVANTTATDGNKNKPDTNFAVTAIIVVLVIVWIFAIAAVCIIVHIKRRGIKLSENGEIEKSEKPVKEKKVKKAKSKNTSKRTLGSLKDAAPLRESQTLRALEDDVNEDVEEIDNVPVDDDFSEEVEENNIVEQEDYTEDFSEDFEAEAFTEENDFEVVDVAGFSDYIEDDDEEIKMSSLSEMKKRRAEQKANKQ